MRKGSTLLPTIYTALGLALCSLFLLSSCSLTQAPNSVMIIAIEGLDHGHSICRGEREYREYSGFDEICKEAIRFSHVFTNSIQSSPALASLLTGKTTLESGFRSEADFLRAEEETLAEIAVNKGFRTAFFSGGPPLLRKTGLHQGFEVFDDATDIAADLPLRPMPRLLNLFKNWQVDIGRKPSFVVFYVPDLLYLKRRTKTVFGESRSLTFDSQYDELDENIYELVKYLKEQKLWEHTFLMVTGLSGSLANSRQSEIFPLNLHSEASQVGMAIKPFTAPRDSSVSWQIDHYLSLTDFFPKLKLLLTTLNSKPGRPELSVGSGLNIMSSESMNSKRTAPIVMEAAWPIDRSLVLSRLGLLIDRYFFIFDERLKIYNQLTDPFETIRLKGEDLEPQFLRTYEIASAQLKVEPFRMEGADRLFLRDLLPKAVTAPTSFVALFLKEKSAKRKTPGPKPSTIADFFVPLVGDLALEHRSSNGLAFAGRTLGRKDLHDVSAQWEAGGKTVDLSDPCLKALTRAEHWSDVHQTCSNDIFIKLWEWRTTEDDSVREKAAKAISLEYKEIFYDRKMALLNIELGWRWAISMPNCFLHPLRVALHLPAFDRLRSDLQKEFQFSRKFENED